ncbi:hypothetical protein I4U23_022256 [Adineta vaga]|nr:hypothetical protein I4U23_022256 [Adineta vaga]
MFLEFLPNEILIQCFEYFNAIDLFYSFDQLNHRFDSLIRTIPLCLTFQNVHNKFLCDQFSMKMSMDKTIKQQIYSLNLCNEETSYPIHYFLSKFSLLEFTNLCSLSLNDITKNNWRDLESILPEVYNLSAFRVNGYDFEDADFISALPISELQTLFIPQPISKPIPKRISNSPLIHLTISACTLDALFDLLNNTSQLQYLKMELVKYDYLNTIPKSINYSNNHANHLKTLIIDTFECATNELMTLLQQTSNLEKFIIQNCTDKSIIDANRWEYLIKNFLSNLKIFKFKFEFFDSANIDETILKEFQNDFWCNQHHWYTEYVIDESSSGSIYTIPYPCNKFEFGLFQIDEKRYQNGLINSMNTFDNVKYLTIDVRMLKGNNYYFSNINSLICVYQYRSRNSYIEITHSEFKAMQMMVNLSSVKHLSLVYTLFETSDIFKEMFRSTTHLSSLDISLPYLISLFKDTELCQYLSKSIKNLGLSRGSFQKFDELEEFSKIFVNLEQLHCSLDEADILFLIKHLPKLEYINGDMVQRVFDDLE